MVFRILKALCCSIWSTVRVLLRAWGVILDWRCKLQESGSKLARGPATLVLTASLPPPPPPPSPTWTTADEREVWWGWWETEKEVNNIHLQVTHGSRGQRHLATRPSYIHTSCIHYIHTYTHTHSTTHVHKAITCNVTHQCHSHWGSALLR